MARYKQHPDPTSFELDDSSPTVGQVRSFGTDKPIGVMMRGGLAGIRKLIEDAVLATGNHAVEEMKRQADFETGAMAESMHIQGDPTWQGSYCSVRITDGEAARGRQYAVVEEVFRAEPHHFMSHGLDVAFREFPTFLASAFESNGIQAKKIPDNAGEVGLNEITGSAVINLSGNGNSRARVYTPQRMPGNAAAQFKRWKADRQSAHTAGGVKIKLSRSKKFDLPLATRKGLFHEGKTMQEGMKAQRAKTAKIMGRRRARAARNAKG